MTPEGIAMLEADEGVRLKPYRDIRGFLSIGRGRCLDTDGISLDEANMMFQNDLDRIALYLSRTFQPQWMNCNPERRDVLVNMTYNLGPAGVSAFRMMWAALIVPDFAEAARQIRASLAYRQLTTRYATLAAVMEAGSYNVAAVDA